MTFETYLTRVNREIQKATGGVFTDTSDLIDFADGPASPAEAMANGDSPAVCARRILRENGWSYASMK